MPDTDWTAVRKKLIGDRKRSMLPKRLKLPILPLSVIKFSRKAEDPNANPEDFSRIIETDSALTCELLRYVNSSATGLSHHVQSIPQAIAILGIQPCKTFLLSTAIKQSMKGMESQLIDLEKFWVSNLERALFAQEIATLLDTDPDLAFAAGMLQDFLLPVSTNGFYSEYRKFFREPRDPPICITEFECEQFEWDHAQAAANVMFGWDFPDNLICCVLLHHRGLKILRDEQFQKTAAAAVALSALIPDQLNQVVNGLEQLIRLDDAWAGFDLMATARRVDERFHQMTPVKIKRLSLLERCMKSSVFAR